MDANGANFINPLDTLDASIISGNNWPSSGILYANNYRNPKTYNPGTIGPIMFYPNIEGPFSSTQVKTIDWAALNQFF